MRTFILALAVAILFAVPMFAQDEADQQLSQAVTEFYESAKSALAETQTPQSRRYGPPTWDDLLNGTVNEPSLVHAAISAAFRKLVGTVSGTLADTLGVRVSGFSLTTTGPELHFQVIP